VATPSLAQIGPQTPAKEAEAEPAVVPPPPGAELPAEAAQASPAEAVQTAPSLKPLSPDLAAPKGPLAKASPSDYLSLTQSYGVTKITKMLEEQGIPLDLFLPNGGVSTTRELFNFTELEDAEEGAGGGGWGEAEEAEEDKEAFDVDSRYGAHNR
jgi:hypothetical protein